MLTHWKHHVDQIKRIGSIFKKVWIHKKGKPIDIERQKHTRTFIIIAKDQKTHYSSAHNTLKGQKITIV